LYYFNSGATSDNGTTVRSYWQSSALFGDVASRSKTITQLDIEYQSESASSLSVSVSAIQGSNFQQEQGINLPAAGSAAKAHAYPYLHCDYPMFRVESEGHRYRLFRFLLTARLGGR
jgi:hypothetical protein